MTKSITMYASGWCPYCQQAERLLSSKGVRGLNKIDIDANPGARQVMIARSGRTSVPQIFVGDTHLGGYDDLAALDRAGRLDELLGVRPSGA